MKPLSTAEQARRVMLKEYAAKGGRASQASGRGHRWSTNDARRWAPVGGSQSWKPRRRSGENHDA